MTNDPSSPSPSAHLVGVRVYMKVRGGAPRTRRRKSCRRDLGWLSRPRRPCHWAAMPVPGMSCARALLVTNSLINRLPHFNGGPGSGVIAQRLAFMPGANSRIKARRRVKLFSVVHTPRQRPAVRVTTGLRPPVEGASGGCVPALVCVGAPERGRSCLLPMLPEHNGAGRSQKSRREFMFASLVQCPAAALPLMAVFAPSDALGRPAKTGSAFAMRTRRPRSCAALEIGVDVITARANPRATRTVLSSLVARRFSSEIFCQRNDSSVVTGEIECCR